MDNNFNLPKDKLKLLKFASKKNQDSIQLSGQPSTNLKDFFIRLFTKKTTAIAIMVFFTLILLAIIFTYSSDFSPSKSVANIREDIIANLPPSTWNDGEKIILIENNLQKDLWENILGKEYFRVEIFDGTTIGYAKITEFLDKGNFILGTNSFGQDNWTRIWYGLLQSIKLALFVATVEFAIGFVIGAYIGFHAGSKIDTYLMRIIDVVSGVPQLIWFILFSYILGTGFWLLALALISIGWMAPVYITRMYILKVKDKEFIQAAKTIGVSKFILIFRHAVPNILGRLLATFVRKIPIIIFSQASLAFLGLTNSNEANLGSIINDAKGVIETNWTYLFTPTIILFILTLSLQFIANGINDALETREGVK